MAETSNLIVFRGQPRKLEAFVAGAIEIDPQWRLDVDEQTFGPDRVRLRKRRSRINGFSRLKMKVPVTTPPGSYKATLNSAEQSFPIQIEVEESPALIMAPKQIQLRCSAGDKVRFMVQVSNQGNIPLELPDNSVFGVFDDLGIETAFASTYRLDEEDPLALQKHFILRLREAHGGMVKLRSKSGSGRLEPGASRAWELEAQIASNVKPGHRYHGVWNLYGRNYGFALILSE